MVVQGAGIGTTLEGPAQVKPHQQCRVSVDLLERHLPTLPYISQSGKGLVGATRFCKALLDDAGPKLTWSSSGRASYCSQEGRT